MFSWSQIGFGVESKEKLCEFDDLIVPLKLCKITMKTCRYLLPAVLTVLDLNIDSPKSQPIMKMFHKPEQ